jgi:hypothetical protein
MDKLESIYNSKKMCQTLKFTTTFILILQGILKAKNPDLQGVLIWRTEIFDFLISKGHTPSSKVTAKGTKRSFQFILSNL